MLGELLFSASYQGNIAAIDIRSGRPIWQEKFSTTRDLVEARSRVVAIDQKDLIKAFGSSTGVSVWQQEGLKLRNVSSPSVIKSNIVIGDFEGYLHFLSSKDGTFLARKKISSMSIKEIESEFNLCEIDGDVKRKPVSKDDALTSKESLRLGLNK